MRQSGGKERQGNERGFEDLKTDIEYRKGFWATIGPLVGVMVGATSPLHSPSQNRLATERLVGPLLHAIGSHAVEAHSGATHTSRHP